MKYQNIQASSKEEHGVAEGSEREVNSVIGQPDSVAGWGGEPAPWQLGVGQLGPWPNALLRIQNAWSDIRELLEQFEVLPLSSRSVSLGDKFCILRTFFFSGSGFQCWPAKLCWKKWPPGWDLTWHTSGSRALALRLPQRSKGAGAGKGQQEREEKQQKGAEELWEDQSSFYNHWCPVRAEGAISPQLSLLSLPFLWQFLLLSPLQWSLQRA